ncbi:hypothetical protein CQ12_22310 [Bradyrhizobium jicamae]|uniref:Ricin B lectin domain-containing protein n=2 Tax=Bradyrhizobium jicamae TaxID=280332 RepID=A0A0R3KJ17_9BRAD|nr:hypothetical protein CQ12_22310 [Bradyrhizobium jicamae]
MIHVLVAGCLLLLLPSHAAAQAGANAATATCGVDIEDQKADVLEAACLREFGKLASREGDLLTLRLENGASKTYRDNSKACQEDDANNCISYRLAAYHAEAHVYSIVIGYYEGSSFELLSARTGNVLRFSGSPHFSPDGSRFVVIDNDLAYGGPNDLAVGSNANGSLSLEWEHANTDSEPHEWRLERWIDNDHIALRVYPAGNGQKCPDNNCDAMLVRFGDGWALRRLPAEQQ